MPPPLQPTTSLSCARAISCSSQARFRQMKTGLSPANLVRIWTQRPERRRRNAVQSAFWRSSRRGATEILTVLCAS
ncbi:UNVERIFIED_CONTAM: hypothetical protein GTU68_047915 [Idotea baltica]|nr:hypothetical protein [Idotea baltica]